MQKQDSWTSMRLILTRHGRTIENEKGILQGQIHGTLSKEGIAQAKKLARRMAKEKIDAIYSSDLRRASHTADIIARPHRLKVRYLKEFREIDFGSISGRRKEEVDWKHLPKDVERPISARARAKKVLEGLFRRHKGKTVLLIGHGGINRALMTVILNKPAKEIDGMPGQHNTSVNIFEISDDHKHKVCLLNCVEHLGGEAKYLKKKNKEARKKRLDV